MRLAYLRRYLSCKPFNRSAVGESHAWQRPARRANTWILASVVAVSAVACAKQGEGERCDLLSAGEDCEDGLVCTSLEDRNQGVGAVCCPTGRDSNNPICKGNSVDLDGAGEDGGTTGPGTLADAGDETNQSSLDAALDAAASSDDASVDGAVDDSDPDAASETSTDVSSSQTLASETQTSTETQSIATSDSDTGTDSSSTDPASSSEETPVPDAGVDAGDAG